MRDPKCCVSVWQERTSGPWTCVGYPTARPDDIASIVTYEFPSAEEAQAAADAASEAGSRAWGDVSYEATRERRMAHKWDLRGASWTARIETLKRLGGRCV